MARINVEESIWWDERFIKLVLLHRKNKYQAMGALVHFWHIAQRYYVQGKDVPKDVFHYQKLDKRIIEAGLAEVTESGIRARGGAKMFEWLISKTENGRKGGRPKKIKDITKANDNLSESYSKPSYSPILLLSNTNTAVAKNDEKPKTAIAAAAACFEIFSQQYPEAVEELHSEGFKLVYFRALQEWDEAPLAEELNECLMYYQQEKNGYRKLFFKFQKWLARSTREKRTKDPFAFLKEVPDDQN